ncbi:hypothetical protein NIES4103_47950 [Nostoc sp. NIES-4103]|nr:hypothetical protein NIES4103_47950 [Nostoc sp. NIES-4103]
MNLLLIINIAKKITNSLSINGGFMPDTETNDLYNINQAEEVCEDLSIDIENETCDDNLEELMADIPVDTMTAYTMGSW